MTEAELDVLLRDGLAPPAGPPDRAFVARVDRAIAEAEHRRFWRARILTQMATEGAALAAVAGSLAFIARAPALRAVLAQAPGLGWAVLLSLLLFWLLIRGPGDILGKMGVPARASWRLPID